MKTITRKVHYYGLTAEEKKNMPEFEVVGDFRGETFAPLYARGEFHPVAYVNMRTNETVSAEVFDQGVHDFYSRPRVK